MKFARKSPFFTPLVNSEEGARLLGHMAPRPFYPSASPGDPVLARQIPMIRQIIRDETWLEGERRGCDVAVNDRVVMENVCRVILLIGQRMRDAIEIQLTEQLRLRAGESHESEDATKAPASARFR